MASRAVDALITYRIIKLLVTPFDKTRELLNMVLLTIMVKF